LQKLQLPITASDYMILKCC